jgi:hypothetical protein
MRQIISMSILALFVVSCSMNSSSSIEKNLSNGLVTKGFNLSCDGVTVSVDDKELGSNTLIYGQKIEFAFPNIDGFVRENGKAFPGMRLKVKNSAGEVVLSEEDMYKDYSSGIKEDPMTLFAKITLGNPIYSDDTYSIEVFIWDKKSKATFEAKMEIDLVSNEAISRVSDGIEAGEIYLFSENQKRVISNNEISEKEKVYLFVEEISGFEEFEGLVYPGFSVKITDANNNVLLDNPDLYVEYGDGVDAIEFQKEIFMNFNVYGKDLKSPVKIEAVLWDKEGEGVLEINTVCTVKGK